LIHRLVPLVFAAMLMIACTATPATTPEPTATSVAATPTAQPATPTPVPATPMPTPVVATASPTATDDDLAVTGRIVIQEHGYAISLPDGWVRFELDDAFLDALTEELGNEETVGEFVAMFGDQLQAMVASGMSLIAFREDELLSEWASNVSVLILPTGGMSLNALEKLNLAQIQTLPGVSDVDNERVELPAGEALYLAYGLEQDGLASRLHQYLVVANGKQIWVTVTGLDGDASLEADARAMAESLEIRD
jgi:hypothetical protein